MHDQVIKIHLYTVNLILYSYFIPWQINTF